MDVICEAKSDVSMRRAAPQAVVWFANGGLAVLVLGLFAVVLMPVDVRQTVLWFDLEAYGLQTELDTRSKFKAFWNFLFVLVLVPMFMLQGIRTLRRPGERTIFQVGVAEDGIQSLDREKNWSY